MQADTAAPPRLRPRQHIIPETLRLIGEHLPPDIADIVGEYFIAVKIVPKLTMSADMVVIAETSITYWLDPRDHTAAFETGNMPNSTTYHCHQALIVAVRCGYCEIIETMMNRVHLDLDRFGLDSMYGSNADLFWRIVGHKKFGSWDALLEMSAMHGWLSVAENAIGLGARSLNVSLSLACKHSHDDVAALIIKSGAGRCLWHNDSRTERCGCFGRALGPRSRFAPLTRAISIAPESGDDSEGDTADDGAA